MNTNKFPEHIFRGYDLRGLADTELADENVFLIGKAYATFLHQRRIRQIVIGRDNRLSGERITNVLVESLRGSGIDIIDVGLSLAQIVYFAQYYYQAKGAIMVSASHNSKEYNGMKFAVGFSDTMVTDEIIQLREIAKSKNFKSYGDIGSYTREDAFPAYKEDILKRFPSKFNFKVVVDTGNDTAGMFLPEILRSAGCAVIEQNIELDGNFPLGTPDPTEIEFLERLEKTVVKEKADMGLAYDPDGDRMGIVNNLGKPVWNDVLVAIYAKDILEYMPGASIVWNTLCSKTVPETIKKCGGKSVMELTGHSFIKARVKTERALFGGELSGHMFFMDNFYGHDDSANATLRLMDYLQRKNMKFSEVIAELPQYVSSPEVKFGLADNIKFEYVSTKIAPEIKKLYPNGEYMELEGVRVESDTDMVIVRASQNGPYITVKFESKTKSGYEHLKMQLDRIFRSFGEIDFNTGVNIHAFN